MTSQPIPIQIPLVKISGKVEPEGQAGELPQGLKWVSEVEVAVPQGLPESCYALEILDIVQESVGSGSSLGVFGLGENVAALNGIYALGLTGREPLVCKVVKSDGHLESDNRRKSSQSTSSSQVRNRRKSFMTPTPLHIPESQVSPIPDSAHEMIYLKGLSANETLKVIPLRDVVWMHPLIAVIQNLGG
jgi:hypothetical protein